MSSSQICPACGSTKVDTTEHEQRFGVVFGPTIPVRQVTNVCRECGEEGDFEGTNDADITKARAESLKESVPKILLALGAAGLSMAYIERALELPPRTLARWKSGDFSAAAVALLRIVASFPWVLEVAERGFRQREADAAVIAQGARVLRHAADSSGAAWVAQVVRSDSYVDLSFNARVPTQPAPQQHAPRVSLIARGT